MTQLHTPNKQEKSLIIRFLPVIFFACIVVVFYFALFADPFERPSELEGRPLPEFQLPDLYTDGVSYSRDSLLGEPFLLNVWGVWCVTCRYELPYLTQLKNEQGVKIVGLYYDQEHDPEFGIYADVPKIREDVVNMLSQFGNPYHINILDLDRDLLLDLAVTGAPETYVIDADGKILLHHLGEVNERVWNEKIAPIWNQL
ncbi:redoxin family protein [Aestuariibacter sp. AA17]|uniref:Redoxin family protein n=1 Tax=Fluctibacter corallii TaxID=2984329 RepID=A0ABT3A570_9ALTE|nr:redoxin family protein [Aestuariibacter sp. AA17]MCV2883742.1 redoxin family protein [Aestuariibacter sp. AA17]